MLGVTIAVVFATAIAIVLVIYAIRRGIRRHMHTCDRCWLASRAHQPRSPVSLASLARQPRSPALLLLASPAIIMKVWVGFGSRLVCDRSLLQASAAAQTQNESHLRDALLELQVEDPGWLLHDRNQGE